MVGCDQCGEMVEDEAVKTKERNILRMVASAGEDVLADLLEKLDEEFHPTHHIKLRIYSRLLECVARSSKTDNLRMAVMHGETLLSMLQVLDGEGGKITKRCRELFKVAKMKDLMRKKEEGEITRTAL